MLRKACGVPSSAEGLDQLDGSNHSPPKNVYRGDFIRESCALRNGYFQIASDAAVVPLHGEFQGLLRSDNCCVLSLRFVLENAQRGEVVLYLLEAGEHGFAIGSYSLVVGGNGLVGGSAASATVKYRVQRRGSNCPQRART